MTTFLTIARRLPNNFRRFRKILQARQSFPNIFRNFPKISEEEPMMYRSHSNTSKNILRDYVTIATMSTQISSHVKDINSIFTINRDREQRINSEV